VSKVCRSSEEQAISKFGHASLCVGLAGWDYVPLSSDGSCKIVGTLEQSRRGVVLSPAARLSPSYTADFPHSIRVFTGLTIVGCGSRLQSARNEGRFLPPPHEQHTVRGVCHSSRFSLSSDEAGDKRRLQKLLILEVELVSALGAEEATQRSKREAGSFY
jgi:hypothetical protein